jgi:membrane-associated phospholipid phosphatase
MAGLLGFGLLQLVAFVEVWRFFVHTADGQAFDVIAYRGNSIGRGQVKDLVDGVLSVISLMSLAAVTAIIGIIALARRRLALALVVMGFVAACNVTTQVLKQGLARPDLGVDQGVFSFNSLPSGHTTVAASVAVALIFVLPARIRGVAGLLGAGYAALTGVATVSAAWHRPSDAVAALLLVGAWAALAGLVLFALGRRDAATDRGTGPGAGTGADPGSDRFAARAHPFAIMTLVLAMIVFLGVALAGLRLTHQVLAVPATDQAWRRLFVAYASSAAGIVGTAALVVAVVLATVHRVVPER